MPLHRDSTLENIHRHHRWEVNNQAGLDALVPDALDIHKVAYKKDDDTYHVLKSVSPTIWVQTAYAKAKTDELLGLKQNILTEGAFIDGDKTKLDSIEDGATADQTASEIKTAYESNADTNALTDTLKALLEAKKVKNVTTDSLNDKLVITYTDNTVANLNINDIVTDVHVSGATLDATTNVLTLTSTDGGADVTVNLSDFVNSSELTTALNTKQDNLVSGTNIKTINGQSVLGSGNIEISDATAVKLTGNQTVAGVKTFSSSPIVPTPTTNTQAANKEYVDTKVALTGDETIAGIKTFSSNIVGNITGSASLNLSLTGGTMTGAITAIRETKVAMAANSINLATGNLFTKTIVGATTLTISGALPNGNANSFILELTNGGSGIITWWSGMKWAGGTAPTLTTAGVDILGFYSHDGGTTWRGMLMAKDSK